MGRHGAKKAKRSHPMMMPMPFMMPPQVAQDEESSSNDESTKHANEKTPAEPSYGIQRVPIPRNSTTVKALGAYEIGRLIQLVKPSCDGAWSAQLSLMGRLAMLFICSRVLPTSNMRDLRSSALIDLVKCFLNLESRKLEGSLMYFLCFFFFAGSQIVVGILFIT